MFSDGTVVKRGTFLYAGEIVCDVCIQQTQVRYGSGDWQDPPEIRNDLEQECFYIWYGSTTARGEYNAGGGGFDTLAEAVDHVERSVEGVRWIE